MSCLILLVTVWAPKSKATLQGAIVKCLQVSTDCSKGARGPISLWDVSTVTDMSWLFFNDAKFKPVPGANKFNGDLSEWDVSMVTDMNHMFFYAVSFDGDISKWDVSRVTNMWAMFHSASSFNADLFQWDVSKVTNMKEMFSGASSFARTLSGSWQTSLAEKDGMFDGSSGGISPNRKKTCNDEKLLHPHSTLS